MQILVSGATGFIGSYVVQAGLAHGHQVRALRRSQSSAQLEWSAQPEWVEGTLVTCPERALVGCDALIHLAASGVSPQIASLPEMLQCNVQDSVHLWLRAIAAGIQHLIICGSCFEFGRSADRYSQIPPDAPLEPVSSYGAAKAAASLAAMALAHEQQVAVTILRPFTVFGSGQHPSNFWPSLKQAAQRGEDFAMSPGEQIRDFIPVQDVAQAFIATLKHRPKPGALHVQNLGSGKAQRLRDFAMDWWSHWQAKGQLRIGALPYRPLEIMRYVPEI